MSTWLLAALVVVGSVLGALAGMYVKRRLVSDETLRAHHDVARAIYALVGTIYAVILAFAVAIVWQSYTAAEATVSREANALSDVERMSRGFPVEIRRQVQEAARTYGRLVVNKEWDAMSRGESSPQADAALIEMWHAYTDMSPSDKQNPLYSQSIQRLNELSDGRRLRLLATHDRVPLVMWILLCCGGVIMVVFAYLFAMKSVGLQSLMVALVSGMIAFTVFLIFVLDGPFIGNMKVKPDSFEFVLRNMENLER
jgi:hypothetical protein